MSKKKKKKEIKTLKVGDCKNLFIVTSEGERVRHYGTGESCLRSVAEIMMVLISCAERAF